MAPHASTLVKLGIPSLALLVVILIGVAVYRTAGGRDARRYALGAVGWLALTAMLAASGFLAQQGFPPHFLIVLIPSLALPLALAASPLGKRLASLPMTLLVAAQSFRLPLELLMHQAALEGTMPHEMTYTGGNFDIVTGATALIIGGLCARNMAPRWLLLVWNSLGTGLLLVILGIAILSLPTFAAFGPEPAHLNTWIAYFPFVWLPSGLVPAAVLGHALLWRRLLSPGVAVATPPEQSVGQKAEIASAGASGGL